MTTRFDADSWVCDLQYGITCKSGGGSGGGGTTTTVNQPPQQVLDAYTKALSGAEKVSAAPLQQYAGPIVAGFTPDQLSAFQSVDNLQGSQTPYLNSAQNALNSSQSSIWNNVPQFNADTVNQYQNPYNQNVVNATQAQFNNQNAQQQNQVVGNAISSGAWGGDRSAVAQALTAQQQQLAQAPIMAGLESQGYNQAVGQLNQQQQLGLAGNSAQAGLNLQGGAAYGNLANQAMTTGLLGANAQLTAGQQQQALGQSILNVPYEQFLQQQSYPFQTSQFYTGAAEGLGSGMGGTSSTQQPGASTASQIGGGLLGAASIAGMFLKKGGRIPQLAAGGVPDLSISYVPTSTSGALRSTIPTAPTPQQAQGGLTGSSTPDLSAVSALAKKFKDKENADASKDVPGFGSLMQGLTGKGNGASDYIGSSPMDQVAKDVASDGENAGWLQFVGLNHGGRTGYDDGGSIDAAEAPAQAGLADVAAPAEAKADPWEALAAAGFGMMAGTSPQAGVNIGQGALYGLKNLQEQKKQSAQERYQTGELSSRNKQIQAEAQKLAAQVDQWHAQNEHNQQELLRQEEMSAETSRHNKADEAHAASALSQTGANQQWERQKPIPDGMGGFIIPNLKDPEHPTHVAGMMPNVDATDADGKPLTGDEYLASLPENVRGTVKAIANGDQAFPSSFALAKPYYSNVVMPAVYKYDATANGQRFTNVRLFETGKQGDQIKYLNTSIAHLDTAQQLADSLNNTGTPMFNRVSNLWKQETGEDAPNNFDVGKQIISNEVMKAISNSGAGGVAEREDLQKKFAAASSPKQLSGAIQTAQNLLVGQMGSVKNQYEDSTGRKDFVDHKLTGRTKDIYNRLKPQSEGPPANAPAATAAPAMPPSLAGMQGLQFSASRKQYRDGAGNVYDLNGQKVQ